MLRFSDSDFYFDLKLAQVLQVALFLFLALPLKVPALLVNDQRSDVRSGLQVQVWPRKEKPG